MHLLCWGVVQEGMIEYQLKNVQYRSHGNGFGRVTKDNSKYN